MADTERIKIILCCRAGSLQLTVWRFSYSLKRHFVCDCQLTLEYLSTGNHFPLSVYLVIKIVCESHARTEKNLKTQNTNSQNKYFQIIQILRENYNISLD